MMLPAAAATRCLGLTGGAHSLARHLQAQVHRRGDAGAIAGLPKGHAARISGGHHQTCVRHDMTLLTP